MNHRKFLSHLDEQRIVAAIQAAEARSSGEIRVDIAHHAVADALAQAQERFRQLDMEKTRDRNGVLIYFAPRSRQFAVFGDTAIHQRCGDTFWGGIAEAMTPLLRDGKFTEAIELAVERVGDVLADHFPRRPDDQNELPDAVTRS
jgi:uncharacterized membrane protein